MNIAAAVELRDDRLWEEYNSQTDVDYHNLIDNLDDEFFDELVEDTALRMQDHAELQLLIVDKEWDKVYDLIIEHQKDKLEGMI